MAFYPFYSELKTASENMKNGNFGLWYNKFVPLNEINEASDLSGKKEGAVQFYSDEYKKISINPIIKKLISNKHKEQENFCRIFSNEKYEIITVKAVLKSNLITGIGETHPHEVSMVFDHNIGIPYIPSSSIKGVVRFAHTLLQIPEAESRGEINNDSFDDEAYWTCITKLFGTQENPQKKRKSTRGKVFFLDAYTESAPEIFIDIMNPHYGKYYSDETGGTPPADYLDPNPIKFLTVKKGTVFIFRAVSEKQDSLPDKLKTALTKALTEEGVGAKTAVGYGLFEIKSDKNKFEIKTLEIKQPTIEIKTDVWEKAVLIWNTGAQILKASLGNKKAETKNKDIVPEFYQKKLFTKKESVIAKVTIEQEGNFFKIIKIEQ